MKVRPVTRRNTVNDRIWAQTAGRTRTENEAGFRSRWRCWGLWFISLCLSDDWRKLHVCEKVMRVDWLSRGIRHFGHQFSVRHKCRFGPLFQTFKGPLCCEWMNQNPTGIKRNNNSSISLLVKF